MANKNMNIIGAGQNTTHCVSKKYKTIVADLPWQVKAGRQLGEYVIENGIQVFSKLHQKSRQLSYQTMSVSEICSLPVSSIVDVNAHLYLWVINKYVEQAYTVAQVWGFKPSTLLVWAKNSMGGGLGGTYGISTEFILFVVVEYYQHYRGLKEHGGIGNVRMSMVIRAIAESLNSFKIW